MLVDFFYEDFCDLGNFLEVKSYVVFDVYCELFDYYNYMMVIVECYYDLFVDVEVVDVFELELYYLR